MAKITASEGNDFEVEWAPRANSNVRVSSLKVSGLTGDLLVNGSTIVTQATLPSFVLEPTAGGCANIAALKALHASGDGDLVEVLGYYTPGDLGGGTFFWDANSMTSVDTGLTFAVTGVAVGRWKRIYSQGLIDVRWFGAMGAGISEGPQIQAAINAAPHRGTLVFPAGVFRTDISLDFTNAYYLRVVGAGVWTQIKGHCTGHAIFDCTGAFGLRFEHMWVEGHSVDTPSCHFLLARDESNGSSGIHEFHSIRTAGGCSVASLMSISSEVNVYTNCIFQNQAGWAIVITDQNDFGVSSLYKNFPAPFVGGNTVHQFKGGAVEYDGVSLEGGCCWLKYIRDISFSGYFFTANAGGEAGIKIAGDVDSLYMTGISGEVYGAVDGLVVAAGATLSNAHIAGRLDNRIYGGDGSTLISCELKGTFSNLPPVDVDTIESCEMNTNGLGFRARTACHGNFLFGMRNQLSEYSFPADSQGNFWGERTQGTDGTYRYTWHACDDGNNSRLATKQLIATLVQVRTHWMRAPQLSDTVIPNLKLGANLSVEVDRHLFISTPTGILGSANTFDEGCEVSFVFCQVAPGGNTVSWHENYKMRNWSLNTTSGGYSSITFRLDPSGLWVMVASG